MELSTSAAEQDFRRGLAAWLAAALPVSERRVVGRRNSAWLRDWSKQLNAAGYTGLTWPIEFGGRGLSPAFQLAFHDEAARAGAPGHINLIGLDMVGPTLLSWGSEQQKARFLPPILSGDEIWCQGFSEPGSGSDLASVRTRADMVGDEWIVTGQKVWSSFADLADRCILLVRTDQDAVKHRGLSLLLLDMHAPGVEVRPLAQLTGDPEFNEIFLDEVRIPRDSMLGEPGDGWAVAMTTLSHERATHSFALAGALEAAHRELYEFVSTMPADDLIRAELTSLWMDLQGLRYTNYRMLPALERTGRPGPEGSLAKLHWSEANQRLTKLAVSLQGLAGQLDLADAAWDGFWQYEQLRSRGNTIEAGTSEILRTIIAQRVLGLPR
jgi:alkylation response protein AidB-like acyl-CoA dehydrogenase